MNFLDTIFDGLRPKQVRLIKAIARSKQVKDDFLLKKYNEKKLVDFGVKVISRFGYDWNRGRQDKAPHPFETTFSVDYVRITTRYEEDNPLATLFSTMHESGHAMYEQGSSPASERTPLAGGTSLAVHESQSRLWENLVGRSLPFWEHFYPEFRKTFPAQLEGVSLKNFYKGINKVEPSLIRVNADEATYNLHIMRRLELEIGMAAGTIAVNDLPQIWNAKMEEYRNPWALPSAVSFSSSNSTPGLSRPKSNRSPYLGCQIRQSSISSPHRGQTKGSWPNVRIKRCLQPKPLAGALKKAKLCCKK